MRIRILLLPVLFLLMSSVTVADVVKPALIEISVFAQGDVNIEIRTSVEALLSGIDGRYRNTQEAPNALQYDLLRKLPAPQLAQAFEGFHRGFLDAIKLTVDAKEIPLAIADIVIPEPGYTQVPRSSIIFLRARIPTGSELLRWYYPSRFGDQAVRVKLIDEPRGIWHWSNYQWIREDQVSEPFALQQIFAVQSRAQVLQTYVTAGYLHILPRGLDHILFILGLFLFSCTFRPLFWQVTMFTLAHSITLSLSIFKLIDIPAFVVEPLIALSIAFIAIENLTQEKLKVWRLWVVFGFGLLHGLGFASMLADFGMPGSDFVIALIGFNLGVELGQLSILFLAWFGIAFWFTQSGNYRKYVTIPGSVLIASVALVWFWQRLAWPA